MSVQEAGLRGATDTEQLAHATLAQRVLVTQDTDFLRLHAAGIAHPGIVFVSQHVSVGEFIRGLILIFDLLTTEDMVNHIEFL
jgi:predicted nuclease of predicted toxin-antitoxin system